ncbi:MAG: methylmalonyl-CoA mutase family protein [Crocinitomicaceae bacterium]
MEFQFKLPDRDLWREKIISELKENRDRIIYKNEIEQFEFDITTKTNNSIEYSDNRKSNEWKNCFKIEVKDEIQANQICLKALMHGAESLFFEINGSNTDWNKLFKDIQFEYIKSRISFSDRNEKHSFENFIRENKIQNIDLMIDPLISGFDKNDGQSILLNGFELQQIGANSWQEIGALLSTFHEILLKDGLKFNFHLGIGQNYFLEIAKIRALKWLCQHLCNIYQLNPEIHFSAEIGFMNKSLKDPHTNLLRQTTEAMAAISGGISELTIRPCDDLSANGSNDFSRRMALNISNILKEESYFDFVKDPLKGSNIIELLTENIVLKAWDFLRKLDDFKSINEPSKIDLITNCISETRNKRLEIFNQRELELIGINSFVNSKEEKNAWSNAKSYLNLPYLIFENIA